MAQPLLVCKGFFMLIFVLLLLSPASASVVSSENKFTGYFEENKDSLGILLAETIRNSFFDLFFVFCRESSPRLIESRGDANKHIEIISPLFFLAAGILAGFNPCLLAVMAFLATIILAQQGGRKEMLKITLGFSTGILNNTYLCRNRYPQYCQLPA